MLCTYLTISRSWHFFMARCTHAHIHLPLKDLLLEHFVISLEEFLFGLVWLSTKIFDVPSNIIHNTQKLEVIQVSIYRCMESKMWFIHTTEYYSSLKRKFRHWLQYE